MSNIEDNFDEIEAQIIADLKNSEDPELREWGDRLEDSNEPLSVRNSYFIRLKTSRRITKERERELLSAIDVFIKDLMDRDLIISSEYEWGDNGKFGMLNVTRQGRATISGQRKGGGKTKTFFSPKQEEAKKVWDSKPELALDGKGINAFVKKVVLKCGVTERTVWRWVSAWRKGTDKA